MDALMNFIKDEDGVTTIEYVLLAAGVAVAVGLVVGVLQTELGPALQTIIRNSLS